VPVLARDEEFQSTTQESMFNFVRLSDGGIPAVAGDMRSEVEVIGGIAERILPEGRFDWKALRSHRHLRQEMAKVVPGLEAIADIGESKAEFQIKGRTFHVPEFGTAERRAAFQVTPLPVSRVAAGQFRLTTIRSEGQFNTVVYEEEDLYRGNTRRDVVMMSQQDASRLSVSEGAGVTVRTETGAMHTHVAIIDIAPGNIAMYYPEANVLVPRRLDPQSKTPAFKCIAADIDVTG
jgi:anaerobic selenocysteine-containing dehydrogenase